MDTLTTGDIAKYCDVNQRTVIRWIESGKLKGFKLPGRGNNRVREEDFIVFLKQNGMPVPVEFAATKSIEVLIVDDELSFAKALQRVLKQAGISSIIATDGFRAGSLLVQEKPALMTLDLSMPGLDGYQVLNFVRETPEVTDTKVLVISALDEPSLQRALDQGADAVLQKPFENAEVVQLVEQLLGGDLKAKF